MTEETNQENRPAFNYRIRVEIESDEHGTFSLRVWNLRDSSPIAKLCRSQPEPRAFAEHVIHCQIEPPGPSIDHVHAWSDDFLLHVAREWWNLCEQRRDETVSLASLEEFRDAIAARSALEREHLMDSFTQLAKGIDPLHDSMLKFRQVEPMASAISALDSSRLFASDPSIRRLAELNAYASSGLAAAAEEARLHSQRLIPSSFDPGMTGRLSQVVTDDFQKNAKLLRDLGGTSPSPFAALANSSTALRQLKEFTDFSMPGMDEVRSLMRGFDFNAALPSVASLLQPTLNDIEAAIAGIRSPWMDAVHTADSLASIAGLISVSKAVQHAFESPSSQTLRAYLGEFGRSALPESISWDWQERQTLYLEGGFDARLTVLPEPAFSHALSSTGLLIPELFSPAFRKQRKQPTAPVAPDEEVLLKERMREAYEILFRFETELRAYLQETMQQQFGAKWIKQRVPGPMREEWQRKLEQALEKGEEELPLLWYADFSDYIDIIIRGDNWRDVFVNVFRNKEDVRVSFQRLQPLRICTMHFRPITKDDLLILTVEVQLVLRRISKLQ